MNKTFYFDHDYDARNDEKILVLRLDYGWEGYGIYFAILEVLCEQKGYIQRKRLPAISMSLSLPLATLEGVLKLCLTEALLKESEMGIFSERILKHLEFREKLKVAGSRGGQATQSQAKATLKHPFKQERKVNNKFTLQEQEQKSDRSPLAGETSDFLEKRKEHYTQLLEKQVKNPSIKGYRFTVDYMIQNNSPLLKLETLTIEQFSKLNFMVYKAKDLGLWEVLPKFDKKSFEFKQHKDAFTALKCFIDKYYPITE